MKNKKKKFMEGMKKLCGRGGGVDLIKKIILIKIFQDNTNKTLNIIEYMRFPLNSTDGHTDISNYRLASLLKKKYVKYLKVQNE